MNQISWDPDKAADPAAIDLAFRLLIDRPPNPAEVQSFTGIPLGRLRRTLMSTLAFQIALPADAVGMKADRPAAAIVTEVGRPDVADRLLQRVQTHWEEMGRQRPHWSVNSNLDFLPHQIDAHAEEFERSGVSDMEILLAILRRQGIEPGSLPRACDYGCGIGRVTKSMTRHFATVTACDISVPHLTLARQTLRTSATFVLVTSEGFGMHEPFDLWYSMLTLQHNPPPITIMILRRMFMLLAPGGVAVFQLLTYMKGYSFDPEEYLESSRAPDFEYHVLPQPVVFRLAHDAGCVPLEVREDLMIWPPTVTTSNTFVFRKLLTGSS